MRNPKSLWWFPSSGVEEPGIDAEFCGFFRGSRITVAAVVFATVVDFGQAGKRVVRFSYASMTSLCRFV